MEVYRRLIALYDVISPTMVLFLQFMNEINDGPEFQRFRELLENDWLVLVKCCVDCNHQHETCGSKTCKENERFMDIPCHYCGKRSSVCNKEILVSAGYVLVKLYDLVHNERFLEACESFSTHPNYVFDEFPNSKTWLHLWTSVNEAASTLDDFLNMKKLNCGEDYDKNKAWRTMIRILSLESLLYEFKHLFKGL